MSWEPSEEDIINANEADDYRNEGPDHDPASELEAELAEEPEWKVWSLMNHDERLASVAAQAVTMMRVCGSVGSTHIDGDYKAVATRENVTVFYQDKLVSTTPVAI